MKLRELFEARFPTDDELKAAHGNDAEWDTFDDDDKEMHPHNRPMSGSAATPFSVYQAIKSILGNHVTADEDDLDPNDPNVNNMVYLWDGTREGFYIGNDEGRGGSIEVRNMDSKEARAVAIGVHEAYHAYIQLKVGPSGRLQDQEKVVNNLAYKWIMKHLKGMAQHVALEAINMSRISYGPNHMPNPSTTDLRELFDRALPYEWDQGHHYAVARSIDRQGATLETVFTSNEDGMLDIEFQRGGSMSTTGHGDEFIVFSTVIKAIREYMNKNPGVRIIYFSGDDDRIALYSKLADKLAREYGFTKTLKGKRVFKLIKNQEQPLSELRRNPQQNNQRIGLASVLNYLKTLPAEQLARTYVSGQNVNKLGINYTKPVMGYWGFHLPGIYAWPADYFLRTNGMPIDGNNDVGKDRHYKYVFEVEPKYVLTGAERLDSIIKQLGGNALAKRSTVHDDSGDEMMSYALNKKLRDIGFGAIKIESKLSQYIATDQNSTVILATKYINNVKAFVDYPEHIANSGPYADDDTSDFRGRSGGMLLKLAQKQSLTPDQEEIIFNSDGDWLNPYVKLLKQQGKQPQIKKLETYIRKYYPNFYSRES